MSRLLAALLLTLIPAATAAQSADVLIRFTGPAEILAGDVVNAAIVVNQDARVDGVVAQHLVIINGTARVRGEVRNGITAINAEVVLEPGASIGADIALYRSRLYHTPGATVAGRIIREQFPSFAQFAWLVWLGATLVVLAGGLAFAFLGRQQLLSSVRVLQHRPGPALLAAIAVVAGLPALAFAAFVTGIGIPIGVALLVFVLPIVAFAGYLVSGTTIGSLLVRRYPRIAGNAYLTAVIGLIALQLLITVPPLGPLFAVLATQLGAGALAYRVWLQHRPAAQPA